MKVLVAFYSRTGTTKKVAERIAEKLGADSDATGHGVSVEEIKDTVDRSGARGYLLAGRDSVRRKLTKLENLQFNPAEYDLAIIGTPIWAWNMSAPIRTYVSQQKNNFKKAAFFCTMGGSGGKRAFSEMEKIIELKPITTLALTTKEVVGGNFSEKVEKFLRVIREEGLSTKG